MESSPLTFFDEIWQKALDSPDDEQANTETVGQAATSDIIRVQVNEKSIRLGKLLALLPISKYGHIEAPFWLSIDVAAFLAVIDFNRRSSAFSNSISELTKDCDLFLTMDFRDPEFNAIIAGRECQEAFLYSKEQPNEKRPFAVVGPVRSEVSALVATLGGAATRRDTPDASSRFVGSEGIPNISPASRSSQLENTEQYPLFGRPIPTNSGDATALCLYLQSINVRQLAVLHVNDNYGVEFLVDVQREAESFGISIFDAGYKDGLDEELNNAIAQLKTSGCTYFFGIFSAGGWEDIVIRLHEEGLLGQPQNVWLFGETVIDIFQKRLMLNNERERYIAQALNGTGIVLVNTPDKELAIFRQLLEDFEGNLGLVEHYLSQHRRGALADRNVSMFRSNDFAPTPTIYSMMTYDAVMALGIGGCQAKADLFTGPELFESFKKVEFDGATGRVSFDRETGKRNPETVRHQIYNFITVVDEAGEVATVIPYKSQLITTVGNRSIESTRSFVFNGGNTTPPMGQPLPTEDLNLVSNGVRSICWAASGTVLLFSFYCTLWTIMRRKTPVVRSSQPIFLAILCAGTFIMGCSIIPMTFQEPISQSLLDIACMLDIYLISVGFSTTFAALFSKTWRINIVYKHSKRFQRVVIRPIDVFLPFTILIGLNLVILVTWTVVAPPRWERVVVEEDMFGQPIESRGTCLLHGHNDSTETIFLSLLGVVNLSALLLSIYQSYRARKLPSEYNEAFYLLMTNLAILEGLVLGAPILFLAGNDPASLMLIRSLLVCIICLAVLLPMFLPKFTKTEDERARRSVASRFSAAPDASASFTNRSAGRRRSSFFKARPI
jgi:ABC-type branched-subunit amino acid transport system substrate-binding protein